MDTSQITNLLYRNVNLRSIDIIKNLNILLIITSVVLAA